MYLHMIYACIALLTCDFYVYLHSNFNIQFLKISPIYSHPCDIATMVAVLNTVYNEPTLVTRCQHHDHNFTLLKCLFIFPFSFLLAFLIL